MAGIEITVSGAADPAIATGFCKDIRQKIRLAIMRAINRTLAHERTSASKMIRQIYALPKSGYDAAVKIKKANATRLVGSVDFEGADSIPLARYPHSVGKTYVSVRVLKEGGRKKIPSGGSKSIQATKKRGLPAVFKGKGKLQARVAGSDRPVILYGPSLMAFFKKDANVELLETEAQTWFEKRLAHELGRVGL